MYGRAVRRNRRPTIIKSSHQVTAPSTAITTPSMYSCQVMVKSAKKSSSDEQGRPQPNDKSRRKRMCPGSTFDRNITSDEIDASIDASISTGRGKRRRKSASKTAEDNKGIFHGLILAISTLESVATKDTIQTINAHSTDTHPNDDDASKKFKPLSILLKSHGAIISPQLHKRVHHLVSTRHAVRNLTQRVRQALKRGVDIIDVGWVRRCVEGGARVDGEDYLLNDLAVECMSEKLGEENLRKGTVADGGGDDIPDECRNGWSSPIPLDCCCVCHENGNEDCPWCTECNITLAGAS